MSTKWNLNSSSFKPTSFKPSSFKPKAQATPAAAPAPAPAAAAAPAPAPAPVAEAPKVVEAPKPEPPKPAVTVEKFDDGLTEDNLDESATHFSDADLAAEMKRLALEDAAAAGIKIEQTDSNSAYVQDSRDNMNVVFIGHVDSGKSTTSGNLLFLTNHIDKRLIEKYEREAKENNRDTWWFAYVMDQIEEEKAKGKTIEVGRALFDTPKRRYTILDAPGHKSYVPNMIAGAAQADVGILVISARKGEFEAGFEKGGQTREHAQLAKTVGIKQLVVAINKMDEVDWDKERYDYILTKLLPFLRACGFPKKDLYILPISGFKGINLKDRVPKSMCSWYDGPSLIETLDLIPLEHGKDDLPFRMPIIDKFKDARGNSTIMGKVESGRVRVGDQLLILPMHSTVEVTGISIDDGAANIQYAKPGDNIRINIKGESSDNINTGSIACPVKYPCAVVKEFEAQILVMDLVPPKSIFCAGFEAVMHIHTAVEECIISVNLF